MSHTKEPWSMLDTGRDIHINKSGGVGFIGSIHIYEHRAEQCRENARRIVACVNACAGLPTDTLETIPSWSSAGVKTLADVVKQRDELLAAAEAIEINAEECMDFDDCMATLVPIDDYHNLIEAIASAKGGA